LNLSVRIAPALDGRLAPDERELLDRPLGAAVLIEPVEFEMVQAGLYCGDGSEAAVEIAVDVDGRFGDVDLTPYWVDRIRSTARRARTGTVTTPFPKWALLFGACCSSTEVQ
jgi:hypothetical protein